MRDEKKAIAGFESRMRFRFRDLLFGTKNFRFKQRCHISYTQQAKIARALSPQQSSNQHSQTIMNAFITDHELYESIIEQIPDFNSWSIFPGDDEDIVIARVYDALMFYPYEQHDEKWYNLIIKIIQRVFSMTREQIDELIEEEKQYWAFIDQTHPGEYDLVCHEPTPRKHTFVDQSSAKCSAKCSCCRRVVRWRDFPKHAVF
jgi:hypothetical protein